MSKNILLIELKNTNLGDSIISDTCEHIIKQIDNDYNITRLNILPPRKHLKKKDLNYYIYKNYKKFLKRNIYKLQKLEFKRWQFISKKDSPTYKYYKNSIQKADVAIIAGGGLVKYSREDFWNYIYTISEICEELNIPLYLNAVGIEGFDANNFRCQLYQKIFTKKHVHITTRDDINTLKKYLPNNKNTALVGDPALYTPETYGINANPNAEKIGIGVVRGKIFTDYGINFSEQSIIDSYINIIKTLEKHNYKWQLFCNGIKSDYDIGIKILKILNLPINEEHIVPRPTSPQELIQTIANYKAIIAARMHANIIATSLGVPSIGFVWNDKLKIFGELIGCPNRYIEKENFTNAEYVLAQLEESLNNKYNDAIIEELKYTTKKSLNNFLNM